MSPLTKSRRAAVILVALLTLTTACSKENDSSPYDPDTGHPEDWIALHPAAYLADIDACTPCHGADLAGGTSKVSCGTASFDGQNCHAGGPGGSHPAGWAAASSHGAAAKAAPGASLGFAYCTNCHGADFTGGSAQTNCRACHGWNAPHGRSGWDGGGSGHRSTNQGNAPVCAQCHRSQSGTAGCFNSTLCHGAGGAHPGGWDAPGQHGAAAKGAPGSTLGFAYCGICHGSDFRGGSSGQSCSPCHGWNTPHGRSGWDGGGSGHRSTNQGNAPVCAQCHRSQSGTAGCFNSTLCHGAGGAHPGGWDAPGQHGAAAKGAPGPTLGFAYCGICHGSDFRGGSSGQSCSPCHGWNTPHGRSGWDGGGSSHRSTNRGNGPVCQACHPDSGASCNHNGGNCHDD